jgi:hypothetical protein
MTFSEQTNRFGILGTFAQPSVIQRFGISQFQHSTARFNKPPELL